MQIYLSSQGYKRLLMEIETLKKYIEPWNEAIQSEEIQDKYYAQHTIKVGE